MRPVRGGRLLGLQEPRPFSGSTRARGDAAYLAAVVAQSAHADAAQKGHLLNRADKKAESRGWDDSFDLSFLSGFMKM